MKKLKSLLLLSMLLLLFPCMKVSANDTWNNVSSFEYTNASSITVHINMTEVSRIISDNGNHEGAVKFYSINDGDKIAWDGNDFDITVTENGYTYLTFWVVSLDENNIPIKVGGADSEEVTKASASQFYFNVKVFDRLAPEVWVELDSNEFTNDKVNGYVITFAGQDAHDSNNECSTPDHNELQWSKDGSTWQSSSTFGFFNNFDVGTVSIYCKDKVGNVKEFNNFGVSKYDIYGPTVVNYTVKGNTKLTDGFAGPGVSKLTYTFDIVDNQIFRNGTTDLSKVDSNNRKLDDGVGYSGYRKEGSEDLQSSKTFTVTSNGTYKLILVDKLGNTTPYELTVNMFDPYKPMLSYTTRLDSENNKVYITLTAIDEESGLADKPYAIKKSGSTAKPNYVSTNEFEITENSAYYIYAKDKAGNVASEYLTIEQLDMRPPNADYTQSTWGTKVTITMKPKDTKENLAPYCWSYDNGNTWEPYSNLKKTYDRNGEYLVLLKDKAGNISEIPIRVDKVDTTPPEITYSYNGDNTSGEVIVTIEAKDNEDGSGLPTDWINFDNAKKWLSSHDRGTYKYTVKENKTFKVTVRDIAGNTSTEDITIGNIDLSAPVIDDLSYAPTQTIYGVATKCTIKAHDVGVAGLPEKFVSWDNGETWTSDTSYTFNGNGTFEVYVRDNIGNKASSDIFITNIGADPSDAKQGVQVKILPSTSSANTNTKPNGNTNGNKQSSKVTPVKSTAGARLYINDDEDEEEEVLLAEVVTEESATTEDVQLGMLAANGTEQQFGTIQKAENNKAVGVLLPIGLTTGVASVSGGIYLALSSRKKK